MKDQYTVDIKAMKQKVKDTVDTVKRKSVELGTKTVKVVRENYDVVLIAAPVVCSIVGSGAKITSAMIRKHSVDREIDYKRRTIYDRSLGRYIELTRPLTTDEALIVETRRVNGERMHEILSSMGLLKR